MTDFFMIISYLRSLIIFYLFFMIKSESRMDEVVEELPPLRVKDLPMINTNQPDRYYELICMFVQETMSSFGVIWNSYEELESPALAKLTQEFSIPMFPMGPFHKYLTSNSDSPSASSSSLLNQDQSCISWLDKHKVNSVVYVSFGSVAAITETDFFEIAWGLANSNQPFLWVVRPGMISGSDWLELLPDGFLENLEGRGHVVKWAPQQEVLAHPAVGAFWTHSGWNSTLEGICEGVPMVCMPFFTDQTVNARYVSSVWKIGLQLEKGGEREEIESSIRKIMVGNEGKDMRERAQNLKQMAKICLTKGGSSYRCLEGLVNHILSLQTFTFEASRVTHEKISSFM